MANQYEFTDGSSTVFEFLEMSRSPEKPQNRQTYLVRANVDGHSIFNDGYRGELFNLMTTVDEQTAASGEALIEDYYDATGTVVTIIYQGVNYGSYLIDSVSATGREILAIVGGLSTPNPPKYFIEAQWLLYPIN